MKPVPKLLKIVSVLLAAIMLANCKAYYPVRKPTTDIDYQHDFMLYKGALKFRLVNVNVKADTLFATISHSTVEPPKRNKMIVVLKDEIEPAQDPTGQLMIPFSSIDYIEIYEVDRDKSRTKTFVAVSSILVGALFLYFIIALIAMSQFEMEFKVDHQ
jgi:hypothetical protein